MRTKLFACLVICVFLSLPVTAQEDNASDLNSLFSNIDVHGFYEIRSGYRTRKDKHEKDMSIMEQRLQIDLSSYLDWADFKVKGDIIGDLVEEQADFDLREAYIFTSPYDFMDLKVGRQTLTWGTGDLVFINDLFGKDWQSFFIGRGTEYLKAIQMVHSHCPKLLPEPIKSGCQFLTVMAPVQVCLPFLQPNFLWETASCWK